MAKKTNKKLTKKAGKKMGEKSSKKSSTNASHQKSVKKATSQSSRNTFLTPLGDRVLVKPLSKEEAGMKSPSGIIIPDSVAEQKSDRGRVVAVGEGRMTESGKRIPLSLKEGDKIMFQWGEKVEFAGEEYFLVSEGNIMAIIN